MYVTSSSPALPQTDQASFTFQVMPLLPITADNGLKGGSFRTEKDSVTLLPTKLYPVLRFGIINFSEGVGVQK